MLKDLYPDFSYDSAEKAIWHRNTILTYGQLDEILKQCQKDISYETYSKVILILMSKGIELVLSTLSVFLSKHIFCIIDVNTTEDGLKKIISETKTNVVFTDPKNFKKLNSLSEQLQVNILKFCFDESSKSILLNSCGDFSYTSQQVFNEDVSHIIYTSGSTANPKGILCSRKAMWNFIKWEKDYLQIRSKVNVSQMSAPWFEPFLRDVFLPVFSGGCICIPTKREELDPKAFKDFVNEKNINILHIVPTMFRHLFLASFTVEHQIEHILLAGEMLYGTDLDKYWGTYNQGTLHNLYGPSETTMATFCYKISSDDKSDFRVKVGRPIPEATFWLIDEDGKPAQGKEPGEVVISTKNGSYGYYDKKNTEESFTFLSDGATVFRTGDIGRVTDDGDLELLGRRDYMRKIYGQKVYPEEIESAINKYSKVKKSIVVIDDKKIVAILEIHKDFSIEVLSEIISRNLIQYKRPHFIYVVDKISVNKSGKIDRKYMQKISEIAYTKKFMI